MSALTERRPPPRWWGLYLVAVSVVAIGGLAAGLIGLYKNDQNASRQAECFQAFAAQFSTVSTEVRAAQVRTDMVEGRADKAAAARDAAFQDVLTLVISQSEDEAEGLRVFTVLTEANAKLVVRREALVAARADLAKVRAAHPIPEPPDLDSDNCELTD